MATSPMSDLWRRVRWPALGLAAAITYGIVGFMLIEGWTFREALYMTVITLSTVGFREVHPLDGSG